MKTTNNIKRTMTIAIAAAMITATAMLSGCGCDDSNAINKTATTVQTTSVEETTVSETAPTLSETDKAITDAGLKVGADGKITDKNGKEVKVDKDGKVEVKNEKGETVKVDSSEVKKANQNKVKVDSYPTNSSFRRRTQAHQARITILPQSQILQNLTAKRTLHLRAKAQSRRVQNLNPPKHRRAVHQVQNLTHLRMNLQSRLLSLSIHTVGQTLPKR